MRTEMLDRVRRWSGCAPSAGRARREARCSICGAKLGETAGGGNASFAMARFVRMKEGRKP
ncbi:MAG: hypothetical protein ACLTG0_15160 [Oscillibacter sp.]